MISRLILRLITTIFLTSIAPSTHADITETPPTRTLSFLEQQLDIKVEIASSKEQREYGLMNRASLDEDSGMLFIFPDQSPHRVWMKNTLIPLDVLFLGNDGRIVSMLDNLQPCTSAPCPIFDSRVAAMYMLELNAGFINDKNLKIGQLLRLP